MLDILSTFGQDDAQDDLVVLDTLGLFGTFEEWHLENVAGGGGFAQEARKRSVPADAKIEEPTSKDGVARLELEEGLAAVGAEPRGGDIADVVGKVGVHAPGLKGHSELLESTGGRIVVVGRGPLYAGESRG